MNYILQTKRLKLREFTLQDDKDLLKILADGGMPPLAQFGQLNLEYTQEFIKIIMKSYKENGFGLWAVVEKDNENLIGYCGLHKVKINENDGAIELAYRIYKELWGKGFATEAAVAVKNYAFDTLRLTEIVSCIAHDNERSMNVAKKVGLKYWKEGVFKGKPCRVYRIENSNK